ncbi:MAG: WYL domain-containing protein, partial [Ilumatobacteraceae bacterium]
VRTFRVDRIEGEVVIGQPQSFVRPADFDPLAVFPSDPKALGDGVGARARVLVDAARARFLVDELGADAVVETRSDGSAVLEVACANLDAFRSWLFGLGVHAEVLAPPDVRAAVVDWLAGMMR